MLHIQAPNIQPISPRYTSVFLAGSIDNGSAEDWQKYVVSQFEDCDNVAIYNPRRDDWDSTWECSIDNPKFKEQVEWELRHLDRCDYIIMYLSPTSIAPISLLELGLFSNKEDLIVVCPEGYHRKGNVDIVCDRFGITQLPTLDAAINHVKISINNTCNLGV